MTSRDKVLRVGVIGTGRMGRMRARLLARHPRVSRVLVADIVPERARDVAAEACSGDVVQAVDNVAAAFHQRLDAIIVATPSSAHELIVRRCLEQGIACFCEKPLTLSLASTSDLCDLAQSTGVPLQVGFHRRFDPEIRWVRERLLAGDLGTPRRLHLISADIEPPPPEFLAESGGLLLDLSIHDFDLARWLTGHDVIDVFATGPRTGGRTVATYGDLHNAVCMLTLTGGILVTVHASRDNGGGQDVRLEIAGTRSTLVAGLGPKAPLRGAADASIGDEEPWSGFLERFALAYQQETDAFVRHVTGQVANPCPAADARDALRVAHAATESLRLGKSVTVRATSGTPIQQDRL